VVPDLTAAKNSLELIQ